ncbi:MAG TPA: DUF1573 domain-containing protein [Anaerolineae bacterium]|nr:DUF1573 domain-containing protein [Anaerolineae bacterium]
MVSAKCIAPGETGQIKASFDPRGHNYEGRRVTHRVIIISNDPTTPRLILTLTANVLEK